MRENILKPWPKEQIKKLISTNFGNSCNDNNSLPKQKGNMN